MARFTADKERVVSNPAALWRSYQRSDWQGAMLLTPDWQPGPREPELKGPAGGPPRGAERTAGRSREEQGGLLGGTERTAERSREDCWEEQGGLLRGAGRTAGRSGEGCWEKQGGAERVAGRSREDY